MEDLENKLIEDNLISNQQLQLAKQEALRLKKSIWGAIVKLGYLSEEDVALFLAQESNIPYIKISDYEINPETLNLVSESFCRQNCLIPLFKIENRLFVAISNPLDAALIDNLARLCICSIEPLVAASSSIIQSLDFYYGKEDRNFELEKFIFKQNTLRRVVFYRESERIDLKIPVNINIEDPRIFIHCSSNIEGCTRNLSKEGISVGLELSIYIPAGVRIILDFKPQQNLLSKASETIQAEGEVVYCVMKKKQQYFLGVKFTNVEEENRNRLIRLASA